MVRNDPGRRWEVTSATEDEQGSAWRTGANGTSPSTEWWKAEDYGA